MEDDAIRIILFYADYPLIFAMTVYAVGTVLFTRV